MADDTANILQGVGNFLDLWFRVRAEIEKVSDEGARKRLLTEVDLLNKKANDFVVLVARSRKGT